MKKLSKKQKLIGFIAIIIVAVIIAIVITTSIIKKNNQIANEGYSVATANAGSSLISNYILNGITIGGITGKMEVLDTSDATATAEDILWGKTAYVNGIKITGTKTTRKNLKIGDYVEYNADTAEIYSLPKEVSGYTSNQSIKQDELKWQIMSINSDGTVDLISENPTTSAIYLQGALGYNNGVYILNDICAKQYSNKEYGITARSIKVEDLENKYSEIGLQARDSYTGYGTKYGTVRTSLYKYYPNIYANENGSAINTTTIKENGIGRSEIYYNKPTTETATRANSYMGTQTSYSIAFNSNSFINSEFYDVIVKDKLTIIASRAVNFYEDYNASFKLYVMQKNSMVAYDLYLSYGTSDNWGGSIRPVVTISADIQISEGDGSKNNPYKLFK